MRRYLDNGRPSIDYNASERVLRAVTMGRKSWLAFQTESGGGTAVVLRSLVMTAKAVGIDPRTYLHVLLRVARETEVKKFTPHAWRELFRAEVKVGAL